MRLAPLVAGGDGTDIVKDQKFRTNKATTWKDGQPEMTGTWTDGKPELTGANMRV